MLRRSTTSRSRTLPAVLATLALCWTTSSARAATSEEIARRWAPIHYQDTDSDSPREDYLASFTYDGNFVATDNWDNLESFPQYGTVYYAVAETCTHWFISYGFYHPHDWSDGIPGLGYRTYDRHGFQVDEAQEHENDLEDAVVAVRKEPGTLGRLEAVLTQAHGGYHSWLPAGTPLAAAPGHVVYGTVPQAEYPAGSGMLRPETAQHAKGHGLGVKDAFSDFAGEPDRDGIVYWPTGVATVPASGNDRDAGYALEPFLAAGGLFDQQLAEDLLLPSDRVTYVKWGNFRGDEGGGCGDGIDVVCASNSAGPPWGQDDASEPAPRGAPVLDPADMVRHYFVGFDDYDLDYVVNDFVVRLRDAGYGPQPGGTIRAPEGYAGPDLASYFDKLVGADGDADGVHSCEERLAATDPRDADSDDDGVGDAADALPLDPTETLDTDGDGVGDNADADDDGDGVADASDAFPLDPTEWADHDGDGVGDNADPDDDADGLPDAIEASVGTDPLGPDSDGDGLLDGADVEFVQLSVASLPPSVVTAPASGSAFQVRLDEVEGLLLRGRTGPASKKLADLRSRVDGCGASPDTDDWIVECGAQLTIRSLLDLLVQNLGG